MNPTHKKFIESLMPFFGSTEEEVISHIIISWATSNAVVLSKIEEINSKLCIKHGKDDERKVRQEEKKEVPKEITHDNNSFVFRDCKEECVVTDSLKPITHGKTSYYLEKETGLVRIERQKYPCAAHAYLPDMLYLYDHIKDARKLLKHIDHNRRPLISRFLRDVPKESLDGTEKKDCPERVGRLRGECILRS